MSNKMSHIKRYTSELIDLDIHQNKGNSVIRLSDGGTMLEFQGIKMPVGASLAAGLVKKESGHTIIPLHQQLMWWAVRDSNVKGVMNDLTYQAPNHEAQASHDRAVNGLRCKHRQGA